MQSKISDEFTPYTEKISMLQESMLPFYESLSKWHLNMPQNHNSVSNDEDTNKEDKE